MSVPRSPYVLYSNPGWGSVIVEAQLAGLGLPYDVRDVGNVFESEEARATLRPLNSLLQIPTLLLPNNEVMTESAAITLYLAETTARDDFVPPASDVLRARFLRWLVFMVANLYPTFTYADVPGRFVPQPAAAAEFKQKLTDYQARLWQIVEEEARLPWFLGDRFSAIDLYVAAMSRWRPLQRDWFSARASKLYGIAVRCETDPRLREVVARNYPDG